MRRKQALLRAVLRLVAREGVSAVTHRAVAAEAGASLRATTYYFTTKDDMIRQAFRFFVARSLERIDATAATVAQSDLRLAEAIEVLVEQLAQEARDPNTSWAAELELVLAIARDPALASEYREFQRRLDRRLRRAMRDLGSPSPVRDARIVLGFIRGVEIAQLSRPARPISTATLRADLQRLVAALTATPDR